MKKVFSLRKVINKRSEYEATGELLYSQCESVFFNLMWHKCGNIVSVSTCKFPLASPQSLPLHHVWAHAMATMSEYNKQFFVFCFYPRWNDGSYCVMAWSAAGWGGLGGQSLCRAGAKKDWRRVMWRWVEEEKNKSWIFFPSLMTNMCTDRRTEKAWRQKRPRFLPFSHEPNQKGRDTLQPWVTAQWPIGNDGWSPRSRGAC